MEAKDLKDWMKVEEVIDEIGNFEIHAKINANGTMPLDITIRADVNSFTVVEEEPTAFSGLNDSTTYETLHCTRYAVSKMEITYWSESENEWVLGTDVMKIASPKPTIYECIQTVVEDEINNQ